MSLFDNSRYESLKDENKDLIAEYLKTKKIQQCPPSAVRGNEQCRATHEHIMAKRVEFRKAKTAERREKKAASANVLKKAKLDALKSLAKE